MNDTNMNDTNMGVTKFSLLLMFLILIFVPQWVNAQDLSSIQPTRKDPQKLDSTLASLYELYQQGGNISKFVTTRGLFEQESNVRVIIELSSSTSTLPQNLGINIETSYESSIQAMVPISNLESVSSLDEVKFLRIPTMAVATQTILDSEEQTILDSEEQNNLSYLALLVLIPVVIIVAIYYRKRSK